jgi:hypothetical protein
MLKARTAVVVIALVFTAGSFIDLFLIHIMAYFNGNAITVYTNTLNEGSAELLMFGLAMPCVAYFWFDQMLELAKYRKKANL